MIIDRNKSIELLKQYVKNEKLLYHCYSSEAVMKALAHKFNENEDKWSIAGLLHDIDVEITNADLSIHGLEAEKILTQNNYDPEIIEAIKLHNENAHGIKRSKTFHYALAAGETITGLIYATALVYPDKKIQNVQVKSVVKRMKEKAFAASVNRDIIMECEKIGFSIDEFSLICINAMKEISNEIGL